VPSSSEAPRPLLALPGALSALESCAAGHSFSVSSALVPSPSVVSRPSVSVSASELLRPVRGGEATTGKRCAEGRESERAESEASEESECAELARVGGADDVAGSRERLELRDAAAPARPGA
jgi:hypothetical protein